MNDSSTILKRLPALFTILVIFLLSSSSFGATGDIWDAPSLTIQIPCSKGSEATAILKGRLYGLGKVLAIPASSRWPSYTASKWGKENSVCASAVNAIHLLVNVEDGKGRTLSILPAGTFAPAAGKETFFIIGQKPGFGLFGAMCPTVGSISYVLTDSGEPEPLPDNGIFDPTDKLVINSVLNLDTFVIDIENRQGGRILIWDRTGVKLAGRVLRPVAGVGRFGGTQFQENSRIRANHPGVIDISTSPDGMIGGFQILPLIHAFSPEMKSAWQLSQWLIVAAPGDKYEICGKAPLFSGLLKPGGREEELLANIWDTYLGRSLVLCRINGGKWKLLPEVSGRKDEALSDLTHLRIYFPLYLEPLR